MTALTTIAKTVKQEKRRARQARMSAVAATCEDASVVKPVRVNGPYAEAGKWRIYLIDESGRKSFFYESLAEAESMKAKLIAKVQAMRDRTIGETLEEYCDYRLRVRGVLPRTAQDHARHLRALLPLDLPLASLTAERAQRLYREYSERPSQYTGKPISVATHQWVLLIAKCWGRWLVKSGATAINPFASVEPIGKAKIGKSQLTRDEAQRLSQAALQRAQSGERWAIGILLMLHLGLRQGEVSARVVRDVDTDGRVLIIPFGKTASSRRRLKVPAWLRPYLLSLCEGKTKTDVLFSSNKGDMIRGPQYWWRKVHRLCKAASVPLVCPHSLRGVHATLAVEEGASSEAVARALGHTSFEMTAKHYASADSVANARLAKATETLDPGSLEPTSARVATILAKLTPDELAELRLLLVAPTPSPSHTSPDRVCP